MTVELVFQSHNGAIAAALNDGSVAAQRTLSIPQWCDCCRQPPSLGGCGTALSIPQWCDCCTVKIGMCWQISKLSIPQWCDCCIADLSRNAFRSSSFQSHNGAIAARSERKSNWSLPTLSIPQWCDCCALGALGAWRQRRLSIPQWCDCCDPNLPEIALPLQPFNPTMVRLLPTEKHERA